MHVGIFSSNHYKSIVWGLLKIQHQLGWRSKWVNSSSPTPPCWVSRGKGHILWWAKQHDLIGNMWHAWLMYKYMRTGEHLIFGKIDGIRIWYPSLFNITWHDTYKLFGKHAYGTYEFLAAPPRICILMVQMTYNQDIKIYAPLSHQTQRICGFV